MLVAINSICALHSLPLNWKVYAFHTPLWSQRFSVSFYSISMNDLENMLNIYWTPGNKRRQQKIVKWILFEAWKSFEMKLRSHLTNSAFCRERKTYWLCHRAGKPNNNSIEMAAEAECFKYLWHKRRLHSDWNLNRWLIDYLDYHLAEVNQSTHFIRLKRFLFYSLFLAVKYLTNCTQFIMEGVCVLMCLCAHASMAKCYSLMLIMIVTVYRPFVSYKCWIACIEGELQGRQTIFHSSDEERLALISAAREHSFHLNTFCMHTFSLRHIVVHRNRVDAMVALQLL